jgi:hypothetical protein
MDTVVLRAKVNAWGAGYQAVIEGLQLEAYGESISEVQEVLISDFRSWLENCEEGDKLEQVMAGAGYFGVEKNTELELHFVTSEEMIVPSNES